MHFLVGPGPPFLAQPPESGRTKRPFASRPDDRFRALGLHFFATATATTEGSNNEDLLKIYTVYDIDLRTVCFESPRLVVLRTPLNLCFVEFFKFGINEHHIEKIKELHTDRRDRAGGRESAPLLLLCEEDSRRRRRAIQEGESCRCLSQ